MGMEHGFKLTVTLSSGRKFVNEWFVYWCKHYRIHDRIYEILGVPEDSPKEFHKVNRSAIREIGDMLINLCENEDTICEYDCYGEPSRFVDMCYHSAAQLKKVILLQDKQIHLYDLFPEECENAFDPSDNVVEVRVDYCYSP